MNASPPDAPGCLDRRGFAIVAVAGLLVLGVNLGGASLTNHEVFVAGPAAEMVRSGHWLSLRIGDTAWLEKPPLPHWLAAISMTLFGVNETALRLPAMLAAIASALLTADLAARWFGRTVGVVAGVIQLTCVYMLKYGRLAEADIFLMLTVVGAVRAFHLAEQGAGRRHRFEFWLWLGVSNWFKGVLFGPALIFMALAPWVALTGRWHLIWRMISPLGLACAIVLALGWPAILFANGQGHEAMQLFVIHQIDRATAGWGAEPGEPFWYYGVSLAWQPLPWLIALIALTPGQWRLWLGDRAGPVWRLLVWLIGPIALLSLSTFKHHHYIIPALPALTPLMALGVCRAAILVTSMRPDRARVLSLFGFAVAVAAGLAAVAGGILAAPRDRMLILAVGLVVASGVLAMSLSHQSRDRWLACALATVVLAATTARLPGIQPPDRFAGERDYLRQIATRIPRDAALMATGDLDSGRIVFHVARPVNVVFLSDHIAAALAQQGAPSLVVMSRAAFARLNDIGILPPMVIVPDPPGAPASVYALYRVTR